MTVSSASVRRTVAALLLWSGVYFPSAALAHFPHPATSASGPADYQFYAPAPTGEIRVTMPSISWEVVPPVGMRVTNVDMTMDAEPVSAVYNTRKNLVEYTPDTPLSAGKHRVTCVLTLDENHKIPQKPMAWEFSVSARAIATIPAPDYRQQEMFAALNELRRTLNKPALMLDKRLCAAATAHSAYQKLNRSATHTEKPSGVGFLGVTVNERTARMGFDKPCFEAIGQGFDTIEEAVRRIFDAPYHRAAFLQPGCYEVGVGISKDVLTLNFGLSSSSGLVFYPAAQQHGVPVRWAGVETNGPLRLHGVSEIHGAVGYPITLFLFGPENPRLSRVRASIVALDGSSVPFFLNSPDNDDNLQGDTVSGVMLTPKKPLRAYTTYKVSIIAEENNGSEVTRSWSFKTGSGQ